MSLSILVIALALAADAFAVSIGKGLALGRDADARRGITVGLWFGGFQGLMPVIGWAVAATFAGYIADWDHWIAFALLVFIGVGMLRSSLAGDHDADGEMHWRALLVLAIATSIDALAAGASFALAEVPIGPAAVAIGVVTFLLCGIGVRLGSALGARWQRIATVAGGIVLIVMGCKIVLEHTGVL